jgi:hypothetical protein
VAKSGSLTKLNLTANAVDAAAATGLAKALGTNTTLMGLFLGWNELGRYCWFLPTLSFLSFSLSLSLCLP